jgi:nitronate monooxygenase
VRNRLTDAWNERQDLTEAERMFRAAADDDYAVRPLWAGEGLDLITEIDSPAAIVADVITEAAARIRASRGLLTTPNQDQP